MSPAFDMNRIFYQISQKIFSCKLEVFLIYYTAFHSAIVKFKKSKKLKNY